MNIKIVLLILLVVGSIFIYGNHRENRGYERADLLWQKISSDRDELDQRKAREESESRRAKETEHQREKERISQNAENLLNAANNSADDARAVSDRLYAKIRQLETRLRARTETDKLSGAVREQQTGADTGMVCSELFSRIDERAGKLAEYADRARIRGQSCQQQYNAVTGHQ